MRFSGLATQMLNHRMQLVKFFEGFQVADYGVFQVALRLLMGLAKYGHGKIFRDAVKNSLFLPYSAQNRDFHDNFGGLLFPQESHDHISLRPTCPCSLRCIGALSPLCSATSQPANCRLPANSSARICGNPRLLFALMADGLRSGFPANWSPPAGHTGRTWRLLQISGACRVSHVGHERRWQ